MGNIMFENCKLGWREAHMNSCCFSARPFKMQMTAPKITKVYTPDVLIIHYSFSFFFFLSGYTYSLSCVSELILPHNPPYENSYLFLK